TIMLVGTKPEIRSIVQNAADKISMPFVVNRWVGGMLTNFSQMKKRMEVKDNITDMKTTGEIEKYTKKERLLIGDKEAKLENLFGGMQGLLKVPDALLVVDARHESIAIREASMLGIQTISLLNTDCDVKDIAFPIVGNDASRESVSLFLNELVSAYETGSHTSA
nr:30S ribosomal protein S2 [Candidatus Paceibacterota bacterium]